MSSESSPGPAPLPPTPPEAWKPLLRVARIARRPLERFLRVEAASGLLLLIAVVVVVANLTVDLLYTWLDPRIKYGKA